MPGARESSEIDLKAYDVTVFNPDHERAGPSSPAFIERFDALSEEDAQEQAIETGLTSNPDDVIEIEPVVESIRVEVSGTEDEIDGALKGIAAATEAADADVSAMDEDAYVHFEAGDDENADVYGVERWRDVVMRVTRLRDGLGEGDGLDVSAEQFASPNSTVEFMLGDEILSKFVLEGDDGE